LGRPLLRRRHRRQPARHLRRRKPWTRRTDRARELVDTDQQADALTANATDRRWGRPQRRPHRRQTAALACAGTPSPSGGNAGRDICNLRKRNPQLVSWLADIPPVIAKPKSRTPNLTIGAFSTATSPPAAQRADSAGSGSGRTLRADARRNRQR